MTIESDLDAARGLPRSALATVLIAPLLATVGVAVFAGAPRSPVAYCRSAGIFFFNLSTSGAAHRSGTDDSVDTGRLVTESGQVAAHPPSAVKADWVSIYAATARLDASGKAAAANQPQVQIDTALRRGYQDYRARCRSLLSLEPVIPSLDTEGLIGQPPAVAYCQRTLTLFSDVTANSHGFDRFGRDRLLLEAERAAKLSPTTMTDDWASALSAFGRLQRTGSSVDAAHPQASVDGTLQRLADDYTVRCPTPIPAPSG